MSNHLHLNADQIINWMAVLKFEHNKVCATKHWGVCMGWNTNTSHVRGHVRENGHKNAAAAVRACHVYGEQMDYWHEAYCAEKNGIVSWFVTMVKVNQEMHRVFGTPALVHHSEVTT